MIDDLSIDLIIESSRHRSIDVFIATMIRGVGPGLRQYGMTGSLS